MFVLRKVTGDAYSCDTLFYILYLIQFAYIQNGCQYAQTNYYNFNVHMHVAVSVTLVTET